MSLKPVSFVPTARTAPPRVKAPVKETSASTDINIRWIPGRNRSHLLGLNALDEKIINVLATLKGTEHFEPNFGSLLPLLLWEPMTTMNQSEVWFETIGALRRNMSDAIRVHHSSCYVVPDYDNKCYRVYLEYTPKPNGERRKLALELR